jgi:hypothetical protein
MGLLVHIPVAMVLGRGRRSALSNAHLSTDRRVLEWVIKAGEGMAL